VNRLQSLNLFHAPKKYSYFTKISLHALCAL
jgi:hypothetical protein